MLHLQRFGRSLLLTFAATLAACSAEDDDYVASDSDAQDTSDELRDQPPEESQLCAELACPSDQVCVVPPLHCDDSGDEPILRRDDAFCRPLATGDVLALDASLDASLDLTVAVVASQLCHDPTPISSDEGADGPPIGLRCPDLDLTCEQLERG